MRHSKGIRVQAWAYHGMWHWCASCWNLEPTNKLLQRWRSHQGDIIVSYRVILLITCKYFTPTHILVVLGLVLGYARLWWLYTRMLLFLRPCCCDLLVGTMAGSLPRLASQQDAPSLFLSSVFVQYCMMATTTEFCLELVMFSMGNFVFPCSKIIL